MNNAHTHALPSGAIAAPCFLASLPLAACAAVGDALAAGAARRAVEEGEGGGADAMSAAAATRRKANARAGREEVGHMSNEADEHVTRHLI